MKIFEANSPDYNIENGKSGNFERRGYFVVDGYCRLCHAVKRWYCNRQVNRNAKMVRGALVLKIEQIAGKIEKFAVN